MNMATERDEAKGAVTETTSSDPDLEQALGNATQFRLDLLKEQNYHARQLAAQDQGRLGWLLGNANHAPMFIAFLATFAGLAIGLWCLARAANHQSEADFWAKQSERAFAFAGTALGFIFGRGSARSD